MALEGQSLYQQLRQLEFTLNRLWGSVDVVTLETPARRALEAARRQVRMTQAVARDYEMAAAEEDTKAQARLLPRLVKSLEQFRGTILKASEFDLIGAVDVAQQTAQLDMLIERLR